MPKENGSNTYYFEAGHFNLENKKVPKSLKRVMTAVIDTLDQNIRKEYTENRHQNFYIHNDPSKKFCLNNKWLFLYDRENIEYFCLCHAFIAKNGRKVDFMVGDVNKPNTSFTELPEEFSSIGTNVGSIKRSINPISELQAKLEKAFLY